jgi:ATP-dependent DNA helicase RecG
MHGDRIEITSPGGLPKGISESEYLNGYISNLRNPVLGNVFFRLHYIEMLGTGVRRIMDAYSDCRIKPKFIITENTITVSLPVTTTNYKVTSDEKVIVQTLSSGMNLASSEIANITGFSKDKVIRLLNALIKKNYVKVLGKGRGTKYTL